MDFINKKGMGKTYNLMTWATAKYMRVRKMMEKIAEKNYTPVDLVSLFDKILLHEVCSGGKKAIRQLTRVVGACRT